MFKAISLSLAFLAALTLSACKIEDVIAKLQQGSVPVPQAAKEDDGLNAILSGKTPLAFGDNNAFVADYVAMPFPRDFEGKAISIPTAMFLPPGDKRVPVIMLLPGDKGMTKHMLSYAKEFLNMGIGAIVIDGITPRGEKPAKADDRAIDATTALLFLTTSARVDMTRVGIMGFSEGGAAAIAAVLRATTGAMPLKDMHHFRMHIAMYPACNGLPSTFGNDGAPVYLLLADADPNSAGCTSYGQSLQATGGQVYMKTYSGTGPGWDDDGGRAYQASIATQSLDDIKALAKKDLLNAVQPLLVPKPSPPPEIPVKPQPEKKKKEKRRLKKKEPRN